MNTPQMVREQKEKHPEAFCPNPRCLWRVQTRNGVKPCPKHMRKDEKASTQAQEPETKEV